MKFPILLFAIILTSGGFATAAANERHPIVASLNIISGRQIFRVEVHQHNPNVDFTEPGGPKAVPTPPDDNSSLVDHVLRIQCIYYCRQPLSFTDRLEDRGSNGLFVPVGFDRDPATLVVALWVGASYYYVTIYELGAKRIRKVFETSLVEMATFSTDDDGRPTIVAPPPLAHGDFIGHVIPPCRWVWDGHAFQLKSKDDRCIHGD